MKRTLASTALAVTAITLLAACGSTSKQTDAKLEQMQKELDETKKQLESAKKDAETPAAAPAEPAAQAQAPAAPRTEPEAAPKPAPKPVVHTIPAGTKIPVITTTALSTKSATAGTPFEASLAQPLVVSGYRVADKGATIKGTVVNSDPGGRVKGVASISIALTAIETAGGKMLPIKTGALSIQAKSTKKKDAARIGIASGVGAAIGAIAGGGSGAAIGAGVGAAGGTGMTMATRGAAAEVPSETALTFSLSAPVQVK